MTRHISVNVGGLWRTSLELKEDATWLHLKKEIKDATGIWPFNQKMEPDGDFDKKCELEEGDDVFCDWISPDGNHQLHNAAYYGNIKAIVSWLTSGADIDVLNKSGKTPLMCACQYLEEECVMKLLQLGANANATDKYGNTSLHYVASSQNLAHNFDYDFKKIERIIKKIIKGGCNPTKLNDENRTFIDILKLRHCDGLATKLHLVVTPPNGVLLETDALRPFETKMEEWLKDAKNE